MLTLVKMGFGVIILELFITTATFETEFTEDALKYSVYFAVLSVKNFITFWTLFVTIL